VVPELVLNGIGMVWAGVLQDLFNVVRGRSRLMLAAAMVVAVRVMPEPSVYLLLLMSSLTVVAASWRRCLCLFQLPLASSLASFMAVSDIISPLLCGAG
jgi:hypothetical protein